MITIHCKPEQIFIVLVYVIETRVAIFVAAVIIIIIIITTTTTTTTTYKRVGIHVVILLLAFPRSLSPV